MKKVIAVLCMVLLVFAIFVSGCPAEPTTPTEPTEPTEPTTPEVKPVEWRWASFIPPMDAFAWAAQDWGEELEEATGGRLKITFYWSESLIKYPGLFDGISSGVAQIGHFSYTQQPERFALQMCLLLPMIFRTAPQTGQVAIALYNKHQAWRDAFGATQLLWHQTPGPGGNLCTKMPIRTMEDLKNVKLASSGKYEILSYNMLGAVVVPIGVGERYHALETGVVDGCIEDWVAVYMWKMYEATTYRTENVDLFMRGFPTVMNTEAYNQLPEELKQIFDEVTDPMEITKLQNEGWNKNNEDYRQAIMEHDQKVGNPPFYVLPDDERERWRATIAPLLEEFITEMEEKGLPGRVIVEDMKALAEQYK